jgi:N-acetylglucosamine-6-phosphate deacetylase
MMVTPLRSIERVVAHASIGCSDKSENMSRLQGMVLSPSGFVRGSVEVLDGRIAAINGAAAPEAAARDSNLAIIVPGFIDLHVHGGGGCDVMDGGDAAHEIARVHARSGTTALLATTMTAPAEDLQHAFAGLANVNARPPGDGARILGVHLEGPFISASRLGAQPDFTRSFRAEELTELNAIVPIRLVTLAPEVPGNIEAITALVAAGIIVQLGHSAATYEQGCAALKAGARGFTHLFNAMSAMHHRTPGLVGAALAHATHAEIIPDLLHVHPGAIRAAMRSIAKLYCVTDSTSAAGMPDGEYRLGRQIVNKCMGGVRLADGTIAGSTLTMDQAFRNLVDVIGLGLSEASARTSGFAAEYLGEHDRGRLEVGRFADIVVFDRDLRLTGVFVEGREVAHAN